MTGPRNAAVADSAAGFAPAALGNAAAKAIAASTATMDDANPGCRRESVTYGSTAGERRSCGLARAPFVERILVGQRHRGLKPRRVAVHRRGKTRRAPDAYRCVVR